MSHHILVIVSSHGELAGEPNGTYLPELTHALHVLDAQNITWDIASPQGGALPFYGQDADELTRTMLADHDFSQRLQTTLRLSQIDIDLYDGVFYPGGYGLLFDLVENEESHRVATALWERGAPVAAVCHGPAALSQIALSDGSVLVEGKRVTGFTREEEVAMKTLDKIPFLLEEALINQGATYAKRSTWQEFVITDGRLITGQNPASAAGVGRALAAVLQERETASLPQ